MQKVDELAKIKGNVSIVRGQIRMRPAARVTTGTYTVNLAVLDAVGHRATTTITVSVV